MSMLSLAARIARGLLLAWARVWAGGLGLGWTPVHGRAVQGRRLLIQFFGRGEGR